MRGRIQRQAIATASLLLGAAALVGCAAVPHPTPKDHAFAPPARASEPPPDTPTEVADAPPPAPVVTLVTSGDGATPSEPAVPPPPPAAVHASAFDFSASASDWEAIARDVKETVAVRADALVQAVLLARALGDADRMKRLQKLAAAIALPPGTATNVAWLGATVDYVAWHAALADEGDNKRHRLAAIAALRAFWETQRGKRWAAPWLVEAAFAMSELLRGEPAARDVWLGRVGEAWAVVDAPSPSGVKMERDPSVVDHASAAALELLQRPVDAKLAGWVARCEAMTPMALIGSSGPTGWTPGQLDTQIYALIPLDERLGEASGAFKDARNFGAWDAARGAIFRAVEQCIDAAIPRAVELQNVKPYLAALSAQTVPTPAQVQSFAMQRRADRTRDDARRIAIRHYAIALAMSPDHADARARGLFALWGAMYRLGNELRAVVNPRTGDSMNLAGQYSAPGLPTPIPAQPVGATWIPDGP